MIRMRISLLLSMISACWILAANVSADPIPHGQFRVVAERDAYRFRVGQGVEPQQLVRYVNQHERAERMPITLEDMQLLNVERGDWNRDGMGNLVYVCGHHGANARRYSRSPSIWPSCPTNVHQYFVLVAQHEFYWVPRRHVPDPAETLGNEVAAAVLATTPIDAVRLVEWIQQWFQLMDPAYQPSARPLVVAMTEIIKASRRMVADQRVAMAPTPSVTRMQPPLVVVPRVTQRHGRATAASSESRPDPRIAWMGLAVIMMIGFCIVLMIISVAAVVSNRRMGKRMKHTQMEADVFSHWQRRVTNLYLTHFRDGSSAGKARDFQSDPLRIEEVGELFRYASNVLVALHAPMPTAHEASEQKARRDEAVRNLVACSQKQDALNVRRIGSQPEIALNDLKKVNERLSMKVPLFERLKKRYLALWNRTQGLMVALKSYDNALARLSGGVVGPEVLQGYVDEVLTTRRPVLITPPSANEAVLRCVVLETKNNILERTVARYQIAVDSWLGNGGEIDAFEAWARLRPPTIKTNEHRKTPVGYQAFRSPVEIRADIQLRHLRDRCRKLIVILRRTKKELAWVTGERDSAQSVIERMEQAQEEKTSEIRVSQPNTSTDANALHNVLAKHIIPSFHEYCGKLAEAVRAFVADYQDLIRTRDGWSQARLRSFLEAATRLQTGARSVALVDMRLRLYLNQNSAGRLLLQDRDPDTTPLDHLADGLLKMERDRWLTDDVVTKENAQLRDEIAIARARQNTAIKTIEAHEQKRAELQAQKDELEQKLARAQGESVSALSRSQELADIVKEYIEEISPMHRMFVLQPDSMPDVPLDFWPQFDAMRRAAECAFITHPEHYRTIRPGVMAAVSDQVSSGSKVPTERPFQRTGSSQSGSRLIAVKDAASGQEHADSNDETALGDEEPTTVMLNPLGNMPSIPRAPAVPAINVIGGDSAPEECYPIHLRQERSKP